jgi:hypothetical protein
MTDAKLFKKMTSSTCPPIKNRAVSAVFRDPAKEIRGPVKGIRGFAKKTRRYEGHGETWKRREKSGSNKWQNFILHCSGLGNHRIFM